MPFQLDKKATDRKLFVIRVEFFDHSDPPEAVTPTAAAWTLTDGRGNVIGDREAVAITSLADTVDIGLHGDDTDWQLSAERIFTVEYTYNSNLGNNLPGGDQARFEIENLIAAP